IGRQLMTVLDQALRVVADDVLANTAHGHEARRDRDVVPPGPLDRLLATGDRPPYRRVRRRHRPRPDRDVAIGPEAALVREHLFRPRAANDLPGLFEPRPRI